MSRSTAACPEPISAFNDALVAEVDIRPAQELWVQGAGDYKVQVFLVTPHGFDPTRKYPLILNVHGGPQQPWTDALPRRLAGLPGQGLRRRLPQPDRLDRLRPGLRRRDLLRLGRARSSTT